MLSAGQHGTFLRLHGDDPQRRLAGFEHLPHPGNGAAGADAGHEVIDVAAGIVPDFLRRGTAVNFGIGEILELLRHDGVRCRTHQFFRGPDRSLHALGGRR